MSFARNLSIALPVLATLSVPVAAQPPTTHGVAFLNNESSARCTVYYKWGQNGVWKKHVIEKGKGAYFSWAYDGQRKSSPELYVRIDIDTNGVKFVEHTLSRGQSPDADSPKYGHHFTVKQLKGTDTRYIEKVTKDARVTVTDINSTRPAVK